MLYGALALLLPQSAIQFLGLPLVVVAACLGGLRGGLLTALWATFVTTVSFFVLHDLQADHYAASVAAYLAVGIGLGWAVERVVTQRRRLQQAVEELQAMQRQLWASQKRYRLLFEASNDAVYLHGLDAHGEPTPFAAVNDAACRLLGYSREELLGLTPRAVDAPAKPGQLRRVMERLLHEDSVVYESARKGRDGQPGPRGDQLEPHRGGRPAHGALDLARHRRAQEGRAPAGAALVARRTHGPEEPARLLRAAARAGEARQALGGQGRRAVRRHRRLQGRQRPARAQARGRCPQGRRRCAARRLPGDRPHRATRRGRVLRGRGVAVGSVRSWSSGWTRPSAWPERSWGSRSCSATAR